MINSKYPVAMGLALFAIILYACSDDVTNVSYENSVTYIETKENLPVCNSENEGQMFYIADSASAYFCYSGNWNALSGKDGKNGKDGKDGIDGKDGSSCSVESLKNDMGYVFICDGKIVGQIANNFNDSISKENLGCTLRDTTDKKNLARTGVVISCNNNEKVLWNGLAYSSEKTESSSSEGNSSSSSESATSSSSENAESSSSENTESSSSQARECSGTISFETEEEECLNGVLYGKCNGNLFLPEENFCYNNKLFLTCNGLAYKIGEEYCVENTLYTINNGVLQDTRNGKIYKTVTIGTQTWMAENIDFPVSGEDHWCYENKDENCNQYGRLYDIDAAAKACPSGWHLPSQKEWETLLNYVLTVVYSKNNLDYRGLVMKSTAWDGLDLIGFNALPAGYRGSNAFYNKGRNAYFWTSTHIGSNLHSEYAYVFLNSNDNGVGVTSASKTPGLYSGAEGHSVRCLMN